MSCTVVVESEKIHTVVLAKFIILMKKKGSSQETILKRMCEVAAGIG